MLYVIDYLFLIFWINDMNENISKNKHMTADQRNEIFTMLENGDSISKIASAISKDKSTVSKEIKKHRIEQRISNLLSKNGSCAHVKSCTHTHLCTHVKCNLKFCKKCDICQSVCPDFELYICKRLRRAPYVCNGCDSRKYCRKPIKYFYNPSHAHKEYKEVLVSSRTGINVTEDELKKIDSIVSPLVRDKSQSLNHIFASHAGEIGVSQSTVYNYIDAGFLECANIDLPRRVRFKKRKRKAGKNEVKINKSALRKNRTYNDYLAYMNEHPDANVIQLDTVEGIKGENLLLTLHCVKTHFQIAHFISSKENTHLAQVFELYYERFDDKNLFKNFFQVILTDNGKEFTDIAYLEELGIKVFFCDPNRSDQKGSCEKNHEFIRYFLPKGETFKNLHQRDIWNMMSHINSYKRYSLNNKSPYEVTEFIWGKELLQALHIKYIKPDEVILNNSIFNKNR